jgi:hypothetical protein
MTGSYTSIYINNFSTIDLGGNVQTGLLDLQGGEIRNTANGQNITVTAELNWTLGAINSSTFSGALNIDGSAALDGVAGATALIAPVGGGTVNLGSNVSLKNGAVATMNEGTIEVINDGWEFNINANSALNVDSGSGIAAFTGLFSQHIQVKPNASLTVLSGARFLVNSRLTNEGTFTLKAGAIANFRWVAGNANDVSYLQSGGTTTLYGGSSLRTGFDKNAKMTDGILETVVQDNAQSYDRTATISTTKLEITGGDVYINHFDGVPHTLFGTLLVDGDVAWSGGTYHPFVEGTVDGGNTVTYSDVWMSTKTFTIEGTAAIEPTSIAILDPYTTVPVETTSGYEWRILYALEGVTAANNTPALDANLWAIVVEELQNTDYWLLAAV